MSPHSIDEDVIFLIAVQCRTRTLITLSSTCRRLRLICMPLLFSTCTIQPGCMPPPGLHPYIQHIEYIEAPDPLTFGEEIGHFPRLRGVSFYWVMLGIPFAVIEQCLRYPHIVSLTLPKDTDRSSFARGTAALLPHSPYPNSLERLFYTSYPWKAQRARVQHRDRQQEDARDAGRLGPLLLGMHSSAESLSFPVDVAPLARMAELCWPRLRDLTLTGRYTNLSDASCISRIVGAMHCPRTLTIEVAQLADQPRPQVFQRHQLRSMDMRRLESLTLAYPDPDDAIFTVAGPALRRLSLCDWPRYYTRTLQTYASEVEGLAMPILSSSECLRILARMSMPSLEHIELGYEADPLEDELLLHITTNYPGLKSLELHQYRSVSHGSIAVRFDRIAELLRSFKGLRTVRLNLAYDQEDTVTHGIPEPWAAEEVESKLKTSCSVRVVHLGVLTRRWPFASAVVRYGDAILAILKRPGGCSMLKKLYLLYSNDGPCRWVQFDPKRYPRTWTGIGNVRVDWDREQERLDSVPPFRLPTKPRRLGLSKW